MRLISVYPDSYVFEEPHRKVQGKNRLTIACHGGSVRMPGTIRINDQRYNPSQLAECIGQWTSIPDLYNVRLISCYSANPSSEGYRQWERTKPSDPLQHLWSTSFASQLSAFLPSIFVRAYSGRIASTCGNRVIFAIRNRQEKDYVEDLLRRKFKIVKNNDKHHYHCIVFLNGEAVKQTTDGRDFKWLYGEDW
ncbi:hypothetical protein [Xenorhabdus miraniensis]|uniref:Uncharacterized protein n=1 Tax=Xenorhabdus miraniensis TaxID=351674 RepID=A0A2D0JS48_9GAMM|nr:hypothetical protein [Xenorhabdus miraniensis]PHM49165.1 hypothetical protein Xmir_01519 [Xenorhabdus miraniensis]